MLSLISGSKCKPTSHHPFSRLDVTITPSLDLISNFNKMPRSCQEAVVCTRALGVVGVRRNFGIGGGSERSCCRSYNESAGGFELEVEIMEFMEKSGKPNMFPTKDEFVRAGRMDLVEAIKKIGGWYTLGWDEEIGDEELEFDVGESQRKVGSYKKSDSLGELSGNSLSGDEKEEDSSFGLDSLEKLDSSSSGRLRETTVSEDIGIEGILNGLVKQRNRDFGINLGKYGNEINGMGDGDVMSPSDVAMADHDGNGRPSTGYNHKGMPSTQRNKLNLDFEPKTWRTWGNNQAGFQYSEFEAAEITLGAHSVGRDEETFYDELTASFGGCANTWEQPEDINPNQIRTRLQHLELELSEALCSLRTNREENTPKEVDSKDSVFESSIINLEKLSDEHEFHENEIMRGQERLRSIRANLAVLEGKMAMAVRNAQKLVEKKQRQIDGAHKALQLLRTTRVVWHNLASEVLLAGSFDGWTSQRKMEKTETSIFSVSLMLYPGRYEIKFIVDGIWKVDPLRPIVKCSGYENNLLIVT